MLLFLQFVEDDVVPLEEDGGRAGAGDNESAKQNNNNIYIPSVCQLKQNQF